MSVGIDDRSVDFEYAPSWLRRERRSIVSLDECLEKPAWDDRSRRYAVLTFDDGHRDNISVALPILERHNAPFMVYVPARAPRTIHAVVVVGFAEVFSLEGQGYNQSDRQPAPVLPAAYPRKAGGRLFPPEQRMHARRARVPGAAILTRVEQSRVDRRYIAPGKPCRRMPVRSCVVVIGPRTSECTRWGAVSGDLTS
nr:polysaccharide deacetylase family protein [Bradyrhizobium iriomotense]